MKRPQRPEYRRNPATDPHLPHTTQYREHPELQIPPEAQKVIDEMWPEVILTFQQWDKSAGMLMLYGVVRDACAAAGWGKDKAYLMRDHLLILLNKAKLNTIDAGKINFKPQPYESKAQHIVDVLLDDCGHCPEDDPDRINCPKCGSDCKKGPNGAHCPKCGHRC